jgi:hypothetical protein
MREEKADLRAQVCQTFLVKFGHFLKEIGLATKRVLLYVLRLQFVPYINVFSLSLFNHLTTYLQHICFYIH